MALDSAVIFGEEIPEKNYRYDSFFFSEPYLIAFFTSSLKTIMRRFDKEKKSLLLSRADYGLQHEKGNQ